MRKYLIQAMKQMAIIGKLFCSEADFQFSLGWELHRLLPNAQLLFEKEVNVGYVDIIVIWNGKWYFIELKYHTSLCDTMTLGLPLHLKNQSAQDILRYDYLYDINRIQRIAANMEEVYGGGYAIVLTNDRLIYGSQIVVRRELWTHYLEYMTEEVCLPVVRFLFLERSFGIMQRSPRLIGLKVGKGVMHLLCQQLILTGRSIVFLQTLIMYHRTLDI